MEDEQMATPTSDSPASPVVLASPRRREILAVLLACDVPTTEDALATRLADRRPDGPSAGDGWHDRHRVRIDLRHRHLPALDDAGLVEYDPDAGTVEVVDRGAEDDTCPVDPLEDDGTLEDDDGTPAPATDRLSEILSDRRKRAVLRYLADRDGSVPLEDLAEALVDRDPAVDATTEAATSRLAVSLHHCHLPALSGVGLIEYDPERGTATLADGLDRGDARVSAAIASS